MKLPFDLLQQTYVKPNIYLCETDKSKICRLETTDTTASLKFNAYSELTFTVGRTYVNMITGETLVNPYYDKIEALRLIYLEGFGYFEIQDPEIVYDGIKEVKNITAYSYEYILSQKYLEEFYVNTGEIGDIGVDKDGNVTTIVLCDQNNVNASLMHLILNKVYGWDIGTVDASIASMSRKFEVSRTSVYDFIVQDICTKFNCFAVFDTVNNKIDLHAESWITKFRGDGIANTFYLPTPYLSIDSVSVDSYKTTEYLYDSTSGALILNTTPSNGSLIEVVDGSQKQWMTDVYVTFDNLAQEVNISYSADDIKTVLTVKGADNLDIREVNMGLPYIVDLSYYYSVDWMGQELFDAYTIYLQNCEKGRDTYKKNAQEILEIEDLILYEQNRVSLQYSKADHVTSTTVGTYYVQGGSKTNPCYTEVTLPADYKAGVEYWTTSGNDLDETKFSNFYSALKIYYRSKDDKNVSEIQNLKTEFAFMTTNTIDVLVTKLQNANILDEKDLAVNDFLDELLNQLGKNPLEYQYLETYKNIRLKVSQEAGFDDPSSENYWNYYVANLVVKSLEKERDDREATIKSYEIDINTLSQQNSDIENSASVYNNFTHEQLIRLNSFLREDEYIDDNIVKTDIDTIETLIQTQQELLECGRIELSKLCEPKLEFSMDMANIYALPEFEPIIHQFALGNLINVVIRPDYVKRARLLEVDINFDDFSDFTCEFGELTSLKTPSSIHADLLASAMQAGKSVASNASYWKQGADLATSIDTKIQQGFISAVGGLYTSDQSVVIDDNGILLRKVNEDGSFSPNQTYLKNNTFLMSTNGFKNGANEDAEGVQLGLGEFEINGEKIYGILAKYMLAGHIESSTIIGGTINIGNGRFKVDADGSVIMNGGNTIAGYAKDEDIEEFRQLKEEIYQNFEFNKGSGLTIGQSDNAFYANITSQEMGFYDNSDTNSPNQKVVNIGNKSATIQNAVFQGSEGTQFENNVTFKQQINISKPNTNAGFAWKLEQNGSLSLAVIS